MDKDTVLNITRRFGEALEARGITIGQIVLYGSYSAGDYHEGSDIDLVVVSEDFRGMEFWDRIRVMSEAICELWEPIESIAMTPDEWEHGDSLIAQFARQGEVVVGNNADEIGSNRSLNQSLKRGLEDAKAKRGRFA